MKQATRKILLEQLKKTFENPEILAENLGDINLPANLLTWLQQLSLLNGIPFNYLVADEKMLPLESIRFFYLDDNWISALIDGAFSIGRNLSDGDGSSYDHTVDKAVLPQIKDLILNAKKNNTGNKLKGTAAQSCVSGFLLRSSLVNEYPHIGVNAFPEGAGPDSGAPQLLNILRLEKLSASSDTLICLIEGDANRVEIHEPAQVLHFGIDSYSMTNNGGLKITADKNIHTFTLTPSIINGINTNKVNLTGNTINIDISSCFRTVSPRVVDMSSLATLILSQNNNSIIPVPAPPTILTPEMNSAEMGFAMTEGVGMVSFIKSGS